MFEIEIMVQIDYCSSDQIQNCRYVDVGIESMVINSRQGQMRMNADTLSFG